MFNVCMKATVDAGSCELFPRDELERDALLRIPMGKV